MWRPGIAIFVLVAACGGDDGGDPPVGDPYTLTFHGQPLLLDVQDGVGAWHSAAFTAGTATVEIVHGLHGYAFMCEGFGDHRSFEVRYDSGPTGDIVLCPPPRLAVELTGHVEPPTAWVFIDGAANIPDAAGDFSTLVAPGTHDLVAIDRRATADRILIRRGESITQPGSIALDLADGFDAIAAPVTVTNAGTDEVNLFSTLVTAGGNVVGLGGTGSMVALVPASERRPGDVLRIRAFAFHDGSSRDVSRDVDGEILPELPLPPAIAAEVTRNGISWGDLARASASVHDDGPFGDRVTQSITATRSWRERGGPEAPWVEPGDLPGWDAGWPTLPRGLVTTYIEAFESDAAGGSVGVSREATLTW